MVGMVFDIGCLRVKLMFSRGNYDTHTNKRKSDVSERISITKTNVCVHSLPLQPSGGASVDEYECVQNEISYETTYYIVFCGYATSLLLNSLNMTTGRLSRQLSEALIVWFNFITLNYVR